MGAAVESGVAIAVVIIFLCVQFPGAELNWWGNNVWKNTYDHNYKSFTPSRKVRLLDILNGGETSNRLYQHSQIHHSSQFRYFVTTALEATLPNAGGDCSKNSEIIENSLGS